MSRQTRAVADGLLYHALNRGNNRAPVFFEADDYRAFLQALAQTQQRYPFQLYGYCLLPNHFHLLLAPATGQSISRIVQSLTVAHTWHYHKAHASSGHVWQGRFKSPVIQSDEHALTVLRYIESNPLRAGLVADLANYPWSSYRVHGLGCPDSLVSTMPGWENLRRTPATRQRFWQGWVHKALTSRELAAIRKSVVGGLPYGAADWAQKTALTLGLHLARRPRGRPRKSPEK
jgi:putative transposase